MEVCFYLISTDSHFSSAHLPCQLHFISTQGEVLITSPCVEIAHNNITENQSLYLSNLT